MDERIIYYLIVGLASVVAGTLAGNALVYGFNRLPDDWFSQESAKVHGEDMPPGVQRVKSVPWKGVASAAFSVAFIYMGASDVQYAIHAALYLWVAALVFLGALRFGEVVLQPALLLLIGSLLFINFRNSWTELAVGALAALVFALAVYLVSSKIFKSESFDLLQGLVYIAVGFVTGWMALVPILLLSSITALIGKALGNGKGGLKDVNMKRAGYAEKGKGRPDKRAGNAAAHLLAWTMIYITGGIKMQTLIHVLFSQLF